MLQNKNWFCPLRGHDVGWILWFYLCTFFIRFEKVFAFNISLYTKPIVIFQYLFFFKGKDIIDWKSIMRKQQHTKYPNKYNKDDHNAGDTIVWPRPNNTKQYRYHSSLQIESHSSSLKILQTEAQSRSNLKIYSTISFWLWYVSSKNLLFISFHKLQ